MLHVVIQGTLKKLKEGVRLRPPGGGNVDPRPDRSGTILIVIAMVALIAILLFSNLGG